jgi:hypothetical protein
MVVTTQYQGRRIAGLFIGSKNANRYFSRNSRIVELQLDHLQIQCRLSAQFWDDTPEIQDPRLCDWLKSKHLYDKCFQTPIPVELVPAGDNTFRLGPLVMEVAVSLPPPPITAAVA